MKFGHEGRLPDKKAHLDSAFNGMSGPSGKSDLFPMKLKFPVVLLIIKYFYGKSNFMQT